MLTGDDKKEIISKYNSGMTLQSIADQYGVSKQYIDQMLDKAGIPRRGKRTLSDDIKAAIKSLAESGIGYADISLKTGVSKSTIVVVLRQAGYKRPKKGYVCTKCGGTDWRANGRGKVCRACSAKRARDNYRKRKVK